MTQREDFEAWWDEFSSANEDWKYADSSALRWAAWKAAQPVQIPDNPCLNDYVDKTIRAHMAKLEANGYRLVPVEPIGDVVEHNAPLDTEALRKELEEVKTSLRLCVNRLRFVESQNKALEISAIAVDEVGE